MSKVEKRGRIRSKKTSCHVRKERRGERKDWKGEERLFPYTRVPGEGRASSQRKKISVSTGSTRRRRKKNRRRVKRGRYRLNILAASARRKKRRACPSMIAKFKNITFINAVLPECQAPGVSYQKQEIGPGAPELIPNV